MKHRIVEKTKIGKDKYSITTYNGYWDYFTTKGAVWFIGGILLLPFMLYFWLFKYSYLGIKKLYNIAKSKYMKSKEDKIDL